MFEEFMLGQSGTSRIMSLSLSANSVPPSIKKGFYERSVGVLVAHLVSKPTFQSLWATKGGVKTEFVSPVINNTLEIGGNPPTSSRQGRHVAYGPLPPQCSGR